MSAVSTPGHAAQRPGFAEFVGIIAFMMGLGALSVDNVLPAFPQIRADFAVADANQLQLLFSVYMMGFGAAQIIYGPLSDVWGRRPVLMSGLLIYTAGTVLALVTDSFTGLLIARAVQGIGCASARVLSIAIVRDRFAGREMARIMSIAVMVFMAVPVIAPATGEFLLLFGSWHLIFVSMLGLVLLLAGWFLLRMPETLHPEYRMRFSAANILRGLKLTVTNRISFGYATVMTLMFGCLMSYVGSSQQILQTEVYALGSWFPIAFGFAAAMMGFGAFLNSRLVVRVGLRRMAHTGLLIFVIATSSQCVAAVIYDGKPPLALFLGLLAISQLAFPLTVPNCNAMAMEPLGSVAGTASSFMGFYNTFGSALIALLVGGAFDGTVLPLGIGFLVLALLALGVVLWVERGKLFQTHGPNYREPQPGA